jgi:alkylation response protein AidB-like acyl-CoA dehydrogenase
VLSRENFNGWAKAFSTVTPPVGAAIRPRANVNIVVVRTAPKKGGKHGLSGMLVSRGVPEVRFEQLISKIGHLLCQNNTIVFENC